MGEEDNDFPISRSRWKKIQCIQRKNPWFSTDGAQKRQHGISSKSKDTASKSKKRASEDQQLLNSTNSYGWELCLENIHEESNRTTIKSNKQERDGFKRRDENSKNYVVKG